MTSITTKSNTKRKRNERGEGVISLAIGVLIMATLGVAMWAVFNSTMNDTNSNIQNQVGQIGKD